MQRRLLWLVALFAFIAMPLSTFAQATPDATADSGIGPSMGTVVPWISDEGNQIATVSVDSVVDPFSDYDVYSPPQRGFRYALVTVTVTNTGTRPLDLDPSYLLLVDSQGFISNYAYATRTDTSLADLPDLVAGTLSAGQSATGSVLFQVFQGTTIERLFLSPSSSKMVTVLDSRIAPAALGAPVSIIGNDGSEVAQVTVNSAVANYQGVDPSYPPPSGSRYVAIELTVTNTGSSVFTVSPYGLYLVDAEGTVFSPQFLTRSDQSQQDFQGGDLQPGDSATGVLIYIELEGIDPVQVIWNPDYSRNVVLADLTPADFTEGPAAGSGAIIGGATEAPTGDPAVCGPVGEWIDGVSDDINPIFNTSLVSLDSTALPTADQVRADVDTVNAAIDGLSNSNPPDIASDFSQAYLDFLNNLASAGSDLADAIDSGDQTAITTAVDQVNALVDDAIDTNSEIGQLSTELTDTCPDLLS